jgi:NitT/TauT family transport system substrate-binding protein
MSRRSLLVLLALCLGACAPAPPALRIGVLVWPPYELALLARDRGYFAPSSIELVDYQTPSEVTRAYRYGLIDALFLTTHSILAEEEDSRATRIAYVIDISAGGDALLARPALTSLPDLAGRRIGVEAGPLGGYMLQRALDLAGLERDEVELRFVDTPDLVNAYREATVDAVITYEPYRSQILALGAGELFSSRQIPGEIVDVLLVPDEILAARRPVLAGFVRALERSRTDLEREPHPALRLMSRRQGLTTDELRLALEGVEIVSLEENRRLLGGPNPALLPLLAKQAQVMQRAALGGTGVRPATLIDARLLEGPEDR